MRSDKNNGRRASWSRKIWPSERSARLQPGTALSADEPVAVRQQEHPLQEPKAVADLV